MAAKKKPTKKPAVRVKAGTSKAAAAQRKVAFAHAYIANGRNGTDAARKVGCPPKSAHTAAYEYLKDPEVVALISEATENAAKIVGLDVERTLREVARLAYFDHRRLYKPDGSFIPVHELDDDVAAAIASIEVDEVTVGGAVVGMTRKIKQWDKNSALEKAMKFHGLYEKDNSQRGESLTLKVELV